MQRFRALTTTTILHHRGGFTKSFSTSATEYWNKWTALVQDSASTKKSNSSIILWPAASDEVPSFLHALVTMKGNVADSIPSAVWTSVCDSYTSLSAEGKKNFLVSLGSEWNYDTCAIQNAIARIQKHQQSCKTDNNVPHTYYKPLRKVLVPLYERWFQSVLEENPNGMMFLVSLRADILQWIRQKKKSDVKEIAVLKDLNGTLKEMFSKWFGLHLLRLERVTFETSPGSLLEKIIRYEAVHPVGTILELKRRLGSSRRCFAFFHPSMPEEPLVFVHVALVPGLADSMKFINKSTNNCIADTAIFYSISSTQPGLQGIDLGNFLIKQVAKRLQQEEPGLKTYSTLSPIPGFMNWLESKANSSISSNSSTIEESFTATEVKDFIESTKNVVAVGLNDTQDFTKRLLAILKSVEEWHTDEKLEQVLKPILMKLAARYIYHEKRRKKALCSVANFHIRNGAVFERLNWKADLSPKGLKNSAGMMVNYKYELEDVEKNNENYVLSNSIATGSSVKKWL